MKQQNIQVENESFEQVRKCSYLTATIIQDGKLEEKTLGRKTAATRNAKRTKNYNSIRK